MHVVNVKLEHNNALNPFTAHSLRCIKKISNGIAKNLPTWAALCEGLLSTDNWYMDLVDKHRLKVPKNDYDSIQLRMDNFFFIYQIWMRMDN